MLLPLRHDVPLAPLTSLGLGGPARSLVKVSDDADVIEVLQVASAEETPVLVLGGGSNIVIGDDGWPGIVMQIGLRGIEPTVEPDRVRIRVAAGEPWDEIVALSVQQEWAGLECMSGIPGSVGATPIQNVGAYGQEVSQVIEAVHVWDRRRHERRVLPADACRFAYRDSAFKRDPQAVIVLAVDFVLRPGGPPTLRYRELARSFEGRANPTLADVRQRVLELRRSKSMVIEAEDPNRRSAGSFFTNPIIDRARADAVVERAVREGLVPSPDRVPRYATEDGRVKIPAAWLIEAAGFTKGQREGAVGISSRHALALVHHGGGTTQELVAFAYRVRDEVRRRFGIELHPEPVFVGVT